MVGVGRAVAEARWLGVLPACIGAAWLAACSGNSLVIGGQGAGGTTAGVPADGGADSSAGQPELLLPESCSTRPEQRRQQLGCWPTPHLGRYEGFLLGKPRYETADGGSAEFPSGELRLELGEDGRGKLAFVPPERVEVPACDVDFPPGCSAFGRILPGFVYQLEQLQFFDAASVAAPITGEPPRRSGERLSFVIPVGQPWRGWCAVSPVPKQACGSGACGEGPGLDVPPGEPSDTLAAPPGCRCGAEGCQPVASALPVVLRLSGDGRALRGRYTPADPSLSVVHFELSRPP